MIYVVATVTIRPGSLEPFVEIAHPLIDATRLEPGCLRYDLNASVTDPERVVFIEQWESREALQNHFGTPHMAAFRAANQQFVVSSVVEIVYPDRIETL